MTHGWEVLCRTRLPTSQEANLVLLQLRPHGWTSKFHYLFDHLTPDQWLWPRGVSHLNQSMHACRHVIQMIFATHICMAAGMAA